MKENRFIHRIDKEVVNQLPVVSFQGEVIVVRTNSQVTAAVNYLRTQQYVGIDTETRPSFIHGVHYPTSLVQIATEQRCYLFQLKYLGFPKELADLLSNAEVCKVGLALRDDWHGLNRMRPFVARNCVELQSIVPRYGIFDLGLQKVFAIVFSQKISKNQQLTNWENEVLTEDQARYASTDAWATLLIYKELLLTKPLPEEEYKRLKEEDLRQLQEHQQQMQALAKNNKS